MKTNYGIFSEDQLRKLAIELWNDQNYFRIEELVPEQVFRERDTKAIELFNPRAIISLIETRILADSPITINTWYKHNDGSGFQFRGFRPPYYYLNKYVVKYELKKITLSQLLDLTRTHFSASQHTLFNAFDYDVRGYSAEEFRIKLTKWKQEGKLPFLTGLEEDVTWVHNDYRLSERLNEDGLFLFKA